MLKTQLQQFLQMLQANASLLGAWEIRSLEYLLEHGSEFAPRPRPKGVRRGRAKQCFANAERLAVQREWDYVEGFVVAEIPPLGRTFPISHAWCVDPEGGLVDPTIDGVAYFGVSIPLEEVWRLRVEADARGLLGVSTLTLLAVDPSRTDPK